MSRGRARIGVFVPYTNTNLEPDMALLCPNGVTAHFARMGGYDENEIPDGDQMRELGASSLEEPLNLLAGVKPDIVLYGCTSATLAHGPAFDQRLSENIHDRMGVPTVTAAGGLCGALARLNVMRIAFASPYVPSLNDEAARFMEARGYAVVSRADWPEALSNEGQGLLTPDDAYNLACRADCAEAEAIVLSCTDFRAVEAIERIEDSLGKPVVTSNQAMMVDALSQLGIDPGESIPGRLSSMRDRFP